MTKRNFTLPILLLLSLAIVACSPAAAIEGELPAPEINVLEATDPPLPTATIEVITLSDGLGRTITLQGPAQRIISLAPSNTEILFAIGAGGQVVGRDERSDFPDEALSITSIGETFQSLNSEKIVELTPDLVLAAEITPIEYITELENLDIAVFWIANPLDLEGLYENINTVAVLTGRDNEANTLIYSLESRVGEVESTLAGVEDEPTVFYELDASDPAAPWTAGSGNFVDLLFQQARGINIGRELDGAWGQLSIEEILLQDPQIILLGDAAYGVSAESVANRAGWGTLSAVLNQQIFPFDDSLATRPGPRLVDAFEELARLFHPELFE